MSQKSRRRHPAETSAASSSPRAVDAIRHVGPTLEAEGRFLPTGELPENRIANESGTRAVNVRQAIRDPWDREAEAMGAERLRTRLPGDTSSDPHTDLARKSTAASTRRKPRRKAA